jgi:RNA polymerase sigma-70 factor (ECF subfamily)
MDDDARLLERFRRGSTRAFDELVARYQREIYYLALRIVRNEEDAEEVAQQAFVNAYGNIAGFREGAAFRTWLYRIAINAANSLLRRRKPTAAIDDAGPELADTSAVSPLDRLITGETAREAAAMLHTLGEKQKNAVILRIFHDMSYEEIARIIDCTPATAKVHFHYGIENLRKRMTKNDV